MATPVPIPGASPSEKGRRPNPRVAQFQRTWYFLSRNTLAMIGLVILVCFIFIAVYSFFYHASSTQLEYYCGSYTGPFSGGTSNATQGCNNICTYPSNQAPPGPNCYAVDPNYEGFVPPTWDLTHLSLGPLPLGSLATTNSPYFFSIYQGEVKGAPWSLGISAGIVLSGAGLGLLLGSIAGYSGGYVDEGIMRVTDVFLSIPGLLLILVLLAAVGSSFKTFNGRIGILMLAFIITWWPIYTRIVRGQVLVTREQKYVEASKASGAGWPRLLGRHIIPNSLFPIFVQISLDVGVIPLLLGAIVFLGFQIFPSPYFPEWGSVSALAIRLIPQLLSTCTLNLGAGSCVVPWWQLLFPGLTIFLFAIAVNFLSDGLRDALDPRLRR